MFDAFFALFALLAFDALLAFLPIPLLAFEAFFELFAFDALLAFLLFVDIYFSSIIMWPKCHLIDTVKVCPEIV